MQMNLRPASIDDAKTLFDWKNDPVTRSNSRNTGMTEWDGHVKWLQRTVNGEVPTRRLYVAELDGVPVGTVRADQHEDGAWELSYTVAPDYRGRGIGKAMVVQFAREVLPGVKMICEIYKGNISSERIAAALGLSEIEVVAQPDVDHVQELMQWS